MTYAVAMSMDVAKIIGANIRRVRQQMDLTQVVFAEKLGLDQSTLSLYENGTRIPRLQHLAERLEQIGIDPRVLFTVDTPPPTEVDPHTLRTVAGMRRLPPDVRESIADLVERLGLAIPREFTHDTAQLLELVQGLDATQRAGVVAGLRQLVGHLSGANEG